MAHPYREAFARHTETSCAFTGLVATTLRAGTVLEKDLFAVLFTTFRSCFLSIVANEDEGNDGREESPARHLRFTISESSARPNRQIPNGVDQSQADNLPVSRSITCFSMADTAN
jgi:hypothetical protein